ncbi:MAG: MGDG synthase family glycosyltransferase [Bacillota bacterium]
MRVLFFSVSIGAGHDLAARALAEEVMARHPGGRIKIVDTFRYINPVLNKVIVGSYIESLKFNPKIWGYLYDQAEEGDKFIDLSQLLSKMLSAKLEKLVEEFRPDAIVCTHAFPAGILSVLKSRGKLPVPLVGVLTDFTVHPFWIHEHVDTYFIPAEDLKYQLMDMGVRKSAIKPFGIPVRKEFSENPGKKKVREKLGLADRTTILLMGGGLGLGDMKKYLDILGNCDEELQILCIAGKNDRLRTALELTPVKNATRVWGFVDNVPELMAASDMIITKPGGLTTAEVLAMELPMVIVTPLPGQEDRNTEFLLNAGVAVKVRKPEFLVANIKQLLKNPLRLKTMRQMAQYYGKPRSAQEAVGYLEELAAY